MQTRQRWLPGRKKIYICIFDEQLKIYDQSSRFFKHCQEWEHIKVTNSYIYNDQHCESSQFGWSIAPFIYDDICLHFCALHRPPDANNAHR